MLSLGARDHSVITMFAGMGRDGRQPL